MSSERVSLTKGWHFGNLLCGGIRTEKKKKKSGNVDNSCIDFCCRQPLQTFYKEAQEIYPSMLKLW